MGLIEKHRSIARLAIQGFLGFFILLCSIASIAAGFDTRHAPPILNNPTEVVLSKNTQTANIVQYGVCGVGKVYILTFDDDEDALVTFSGDEPLPYPVHIAGGRNVIIKGLEIVIQTQPGNEVGTLTLPANAHNEKNPHPLVPACGGLRLNVKSSATHWVEGLHLDMAGHDADGIIVNSDTNPISSMVAIQNSLIEGIEGNLVFHGDILQTQNGHLKNILFENVTMRQSLEGVVFSFPVDNAVLRNINYDTDSRYDADDPWDDLVVGGFFAGDRVQSSYDLKSIYIKYKNPMTDLWFLIKDKHFTSPEGAGREICLFGVCLIVESHPQVHYGQSPPNGDYAPAARVGKYYQLIDDSNGDSDDHYLLDIIMPILSATRKEK